MPGAGQNTHYFLLCNVCSGSLGRFNYFKRKWSVLTRYKILTINLKDIWINRIIQ